jgi:hypothetical protein
MINDVGFSQFSTNTEYIMNSCNYLALGSEKTEPKILAPLSECAERGGTGAVAAPFQDCTTPIAHRR